MLLVTRFSLIEGVLPHLVVIHVDMLSLQVQNSRPIVLWLALLLHLHIATRRSAGLGINYMELPSETKSQITCTLALLQKYFTGGEVRSGAMLCITITGHSRVMEEQLLHAAHSQSQPGWSLLITRPGKSKTSNLHFLIEKPQCYFLIIDNLDDQEFNEIFEHWKYMVNWNPLAQFVIYLSAVEETDEELTELMIELMFIFMNQMVYNVNVIGRSNESRLYYGKSVFPYDPDNNCGKRVINIVILDTCDYEELTDEPVDTAKSLGNPSIEQLTSANFEDKFLRDLSGCSIKIGYRGNWEPYIFATNQADSFIYEYNASFNKTTITYYDDYAVEDADEASELDEADKADDADEGIIDSMYARSNQLTEAQESQPKLSGLEYELLEIIAQRLHVSLEFKQKSNNMFQLFQQLIDGQVDLVVGGIDEDPSISRSVSSTISYHQDELTWCVSKAKRKYNFFNFLASFNVNAWLLFLLFIITNSLAVLAAQQLTGHYLSGVDTYSAICIRMLGILLSQAVNFRFQHLPTMFRFLFYLAFLMAFFFSNTYQSFLISTLTTPTAQAQVSHLAEIYSNRITTMVTSDHLRHFDKKGEIFKYIRENFQICHNIVDCLNEAVDNERISVVASRQHALYNARIQRDHIYCFDRPETLYVYPVTMLVPRQYQLLQQINAVIRNVIESGYMLKWARDLDMVRLIKERVARAQEDTLKPLTLAAFKGIFIFASELLLLASSVFGLECLVHWMVVRRRTRLKLLRYLHRRFGSQHGRVTASRIRPVRR